MSGVSGPASLSAALGDGRPVALESALLANGQPSLALDLALELISQSAAERDGAPRPAFPEQPLRLLEQSGALAATANAGAGSLPAVVELDLVRRVARADGSVGRIFDGHLNAVERLVVQAPPELRERELAAVRAGRLRAGVWGGEPLPHEGRSATIVTAHEAEYLRGVKTFCSGAGGLDRALVIAKDPADPRPAAVWVDLTDRDRVEIDERWYRGAGLRASASHRVVFHDAPVIARFGGPGAIAEQPWFSRDALRTAASWVGIADLAVDSALAELVARPDRGPLEGLAAGRLITARRTIELWLQAAAEAMDGGGSDLAVTGVQARVAIAQACVGLLDEAARACGSRPFAAAAGLDRARRDLDLLLLQHRLEPMLARAGEATLQERTP